MGSKSSWEGHPQRGVGEKGDLHEDPDREGETNGGGGLILFSHQSGEMSIGKGGVFWGRMSQYRRRRGTRKLSSGGASF